MGTRSIHERFASRRAEAFVGSGRILASLAIVVSGVFLGTSCSKEADAPEVSRGNAGSVTSTGMGGTSATVVQQRRGLDLRP